MKRLQAVLRKYNKQFKLAVHSKIKKTTSLHFKKDEVTLTAGKRQQVYRQAASHIMRKLTKHTTLPPRG